MNKLTPRIAVAFLIGSFFTLVVPAAESLSVLLQKGIYAEETEGNLDSAIKIYQQIGAEAAANRTIAAQAQYRLAVCFQKLGKNEQAVAVLKELVRQFPNEATLGEQAQARLAELGQAPTDVVTMRRIPVAMSGNVMAVSPDGRYFASWWNSLDIKVTEIPTAKSWTVVKGTDSEHVFGQMAFSPDGQRIAYDLGGTTIVISRSDASESRRVYVMPQGTEGHLIVLGWSPDASRLIVFRSFGRRSTIPSILGEVEVQSGNWKEIRTVPRRNRSKIVLSPDGRYVAGHEAMQNEPGNITVYDLATKDEATLVGRDVNGFAGWSPWWGDKLLFTSDRTGTMGLWSITMKEGRAVGGPQLVSAGFGQRNIQGVGSDGSIYYVETRGSSDVYVMSANFETGEVMREPRRVSDRSPGYQSLPVWSKDGQSLMMSVSTNTRGLMVVSMASGETQEHSAAVRLPFWRTTWSQAGGFVLFQAFGVGNRSGIHRYDLATGKIETVADNDELGGMNSQPELSLDENSFYFVRRLWDRNPLTEKDEQRNQIIRRDLRTAKEEIVYGPVPNLSIWDQSKLSPDGRQLAFFTTEVKEIDGKFEALANAINVLSLDGGQPRAVAQLGPGSLRAGIAWTPDGKRIAYVRDGKIWSTAIGSGETVSLNTSKVALGNLAINPDGRQIAFAGKVDGPSGRELWVMEGALTRQKSAVMTVK